MAAAAAAAAPVSRPTGRFDREVTNDQIKAMAGEAGASLASGLQLYGAYNSQQQQQQAKPPPPPPQSTTSGRPAKPAAPPPPSSSHSKHAPSSSRPPSSSSRHQPSGKASAEAGIPIIIVPSGERT